MSSWTEHCWKQRYHLLSWPLFQCLTTLVVKSPSPPCLVSNWNFPYCNLALSPLVLSPPRRGWLHLFHILLLRSWRQHQPWDFSRLNSPRSLSLSSLVTCSGPQTPWWPFAGLAPASWCLSKSQTLQRRFHKWWQKGGNASLSPLATLAHTALYVAGRLCHRHTLLAH